MSASGEANPQLAMNINIQGFVNALEACRNHGLRLFAPSSIAAFGPSTPREKTPDLTIMRPTTIYGVTKVHLELLGQYFMLKYGVDFRSLRLIKKLQNENEKIFLKNKFHFKSKDILELFHLNLFQEEERQIMQ